eukprot:7435115-Ditylum_brightwellii.AAC.1
MPANNDAATTTKKSKKEERYTNCHLKHLLKNPPGTTTEEWYNTLKNHPTAKELFALAILHAQHILEDCFEKLHLDAHPVEVLPYPKEEVVIILNALLSFDPDYKE